MVALSLKDVEKSLGAGPYLCQCLAVAGLASYYAIKLWNPSLEVP